MNWITYFFGGVGVASKDLKFSNLFNKYKKYLATKKYKTSNKSQII
jgi:hypothetical protein